MLKLGVVLAPLLAATPSPADSPKAFEVPAVLSATELQLSDGRTVRLAGIRVPEQIAQEAKGTLRSLIRDEAVRWTPADPPTDRWGRMRGQVERIDGRWLQGALLESGLAVVDPDAGVPDLDQMRARERAARSAGRGLWSRRDAVLPADPARLQPGFAIVQGDVRELARTRSAVYLNFGEPWWSDFTIKVGRTAVERAFEARGLALDSLVGRTVEARGFIVEAGGPLIELSHPAQLEVVR